VKRETVLLYFDAFSYASRFSISLRWGSVGELANSNLGFFSY